MGEPVTSTTFISSMTIPFIFTITITITILRAYCEEEGRQLQQISAIFTEEWHQLNFGSNIVAEYIHFCEYKPEIAPAFFKTVNLTIRWACDY